MNKKIQKSSLLFGIIITILAYLCFAIAAACVRVLSTAIPAVEILFFQNIIALAILIPYCYKRGTLKFQKPYLSVHLIRDITGMLSYLTYFFAIQRIGLIDATLLAYTAPFFTPFVWRIWMKEKVAKNVWWAIILGFGGIAVILKPGETLMEMGAVIGVISGIFSSVSLVAIRILNMKNTSRSRSLFYYFFVGAVLMLPLALINWVPLNINQFFLSITIGIFIAIGQILLTTAYRYGTASFLSPLCYFTIIFAGIISWIFFDHTPGWGNLIGAILIIVGGTLTLIFRKKPKDIFRFFAHAQRKKKKNPPNPS